MEVFTAIGLFICLSFALVLLGIGAFILLLKLGVIAGYWRRRDPDVIDAEYTLAQQEDISAQPPSPLPPRSSSPDDEH